MSCAIVLSVCLSSKVTAQASTIAMPILPYVPPETTQIMDYIFNSFGATAADIAEGVEKKAAYVKLWAKFFGASADIAWNELMDTIDRGKTSGKLVFTPDLTQQLNGVIAYAIDNGMEYGASYPASLTAAQWQDRLSAQYNIHISAAACNNMYSYRATNYQVNKESFLVYAIGKVHGENRVTITFATMATMFGTVARWQKHTNNFYYPMYVNGSINGVASVSFYTYEWNAETRTVGALVNSAYGGIALDVVQEQGTTGAYAGSVAPIQAQNTTIFDGLHNAIVHAVSAFTSLTQNGEIDITKPTIIPMPKVDVVPATTTADLPQAQEQNGAAPAVTGEDIQALIQSIQAAQAAQYGDVSEYSLDLTQYFPFCIPFDIGNLLTMFVAEPQAPRVEFQLPIGYDTEEGIIFDEFVMDLSQFDEVAVWVRRGMLLVFIVGLGMVTRQVFTRG